MMQLSEQNPSVFQNDSEYLEAYSEICNYMWSRYYLVRKLHNPQSCQDQKVDERIIRELIFDMTEKVRGAEWLFWEKAAKSTASGVSFVADIIALHYELGHFEKRVLLLLLCSEFMGIEKHDLNAQDIVNLLDTENLISERLKNFTRCQAESPLFKLEVLKEDGFWSSKCAVNRKIVEFVSEKLSGQEAELPQREKSENEKSQEKEERGKNAAQKFEQVILGREIKGRIEFFLDVYQSKKFKELKVDQTIRFASGLTFLFYGPPGTGKTMLAEAIAERLGKKILIAETSKIFAPYLGETDKNISELFEKAKKDDAVLLLDEADSLIASREMSGGDYKVRFVNLLLTELERFEGIAILTTNMRDVLDKALERRIALKVEFKLPEIDKREAIWRGHIPQSFSLDSGVRFNKLAQEYEFSGGNIKNAMLNALRRVIARNETRITMDDLIFGAELEKEGAVSMLHHPRIGF